MGALPEGRNYVCPTVFFDVAMNNAKALNAIENKIGEFVRKHGFEGKLLLSTNGPKQDLPKGFNLQIPKDAIEWDQLMSLLK